MTTTTLVHSSFVQGSDPRLIEQVFEVRGTDDRTRALADAESALAPAFTDLPHFVHAVTSPDEGAWRITIRLTARQSR